MAITVVTSDSRIFTGEDGFEEITIAVQRYWCKHCEKPFDANISELFYEECLSGNPIVDLCLYPAAENPFNRVERILHTHYGIQVDRDTIQRYAEIFADRIQDRHGMTDVDELLSVNFLSLLFGTQTAAEFLEEYADELTTEGVAGLVGDTDETYPVKKALCEENFRRNAQGETQKPSGYSFWGPVATCPNWTISQAFSAESPTSRGCWQPCSSLRLRVLIIGLLVMISVTTERFRARRRVSSIKCDSSSDRTRGSQHSEIPERSRRYRATSKRCTRSNSRNAPRYSGGSTWRSGMRRWKRSAAQSVQTGSKAETGS